MTYPFLDVARGLAVQAGAAIMKLRESPLIQHRKPDHSLVTNADHEADRILCEGLRKAFPEHSILSEESGFSGLPNAEFLWLVDPVDGTKAYAQGRSGFSVMVGLLKRGKPFAGVVYDPLEDHFYEAQEGEGTYHTHAGIRTRVRVSNRTDFSRMPVITSTGFPEMLDGPLRKELLGPWIPAVNSVGVKVGFIVRRLVDIYMNHHLVHYWDTAAPQIILEQAGGRFTYADGSPLAYDLETTCHPHATLATNGVCHKDLLRMLGRVTPRFA